MDNCLFCRIIAGEIPSSKVYENDWVYAFRDINPQAPVHVLIVPKKHIDSVAAIDADNSLYGAKCLEAAAEIASAEGLDKGFRLISNCGEDGGQSVMHLHFHLIGGVKLSEKIV